MRVPESGKDKEGYIAGWGGGVSIPPGSNVMKQIPASRKIHPQNIFICVIINAI